MSSPMVAFVVALVTCLVLIPPMRRLALRIGMVDQPGPRKIHQAPIPLLGCVAVYGGFLLAVLVGVAGEMTMQMVAVLGGATLLVTVGILDDRGWLHHQIKLFVGMPVAGLFLLLSGIRTEVFSTFMAEPAGRWLDAGLTILGVVGFTAAFSILDHMDGLCAGTAVVAAGFFVVLALRTGQHSVAALGAAVLGAALGYLPWNFSSAKVFMGDGGAMMLGFLMATLGLKLRDPELPPPAGYLLPLFVLIVPILDTTLISVSRLRRGFLPFTTPGKDHAAHRLANLGLGQRGAVVTLYGLGAASGALAVATRAASREHALLIAGALLLFLLGAVVLLERAPYEKQVKEA